MCIARRRMLSQISFLSFILIAFCAVQPCRAAQVSGPWTLLEPAEVPKARIAPRVQLLSHQALRLDIDAFRQTADRAPLETEKTAPLIVELPHPSGKMQRFAIVESPVMEPELAAKYPEIKTWSGQGLDDPLASLRLDVTLAGLHAQVITPDGTWYIDPLYADNPVEHASYLRTQFVKSVQWECGVTSEMMDARVERASKSGTKNNGETLRSFRLAMAATGEYTQFHGGTVPGALAAIVTTMNRVNGIYERELAVRMVLIGNNDQLIFTNGATDPYTNDDGDAMLAQNQNTITSIIGSANYDIGHVLSTGGGGIAALGSVCATMFKAQGVTGSSNPQGDPFDVDFVAHEIGHQFDAPHTFNGINGSCGGNRSSFDAFEPGSGSTIMAYAGICGADNLQANSDPWFHSVSLESITAFLNDTSSGAICASGSATGNQIPTVDAGPNTSIPIGTPFTLTATGSDPNGDLLLFSWEQRDLGLSGQALAEPDNGQGPLFRFFPPAASPSRTFPRLDNILSGVSTLDEELPVFSRTMNFIVVARDNRNGGGAYRSDTMQIEVTDAAGPFEVTLPNASSIGSGVLLVTWTVAGTDSAPVNASQVDIELSTDGGQSFPYLLANNTPNDGSQLVTLPDLLSNSARIRVSAADNIFFNINPSDFLINPGTMLTLTGQQDVMDSNFNGKVEPGETGVELFVEVLNASTTQTATGISATIAPLTATATATVASAAYADLGPAGTGYNLSPFILDIDENHPCGQPIQFEINLTANGGGFDETLIFVVEVQTPTTVELGQTTLVASGLPITIADEATVTSSVNVAENMDVIGARVLNLDIDHSFAPDLEIVLISPSGTRVTLASGLGQRFIDTYPGTSFDDAAPTAINQDPPPFMGTYRPMMPLSALNGEPAQGQWTLEVSDNLPEDSGSLQGWTLELQLGEIRCSPPVTAARDTELYR